MKTNFISEETLHAFASLLCRAANRFAYVSIETVEADLTGTAYSGWAGALPGVLNSRAPHVARCKMGELVLAGAGNDGKLILTPIQGNELSLGWMGGVAQFGFAVSVSKWAQEHDRLLALILLYSHEHEYLDLHHVGFRFESHDDYEMANSVRGNGMVRDVPNDHMRTYFATADGFYIEHQYFPDGPKTLATHWDFVTGDPKEFLWFIASAYGTEPTYFEDSGPNDPVGVVWITGGDGTLLGVMSRRTDWKIEEE